MGVYFYFALREDHFVPGREQERGFIETLKDGVMAVRSAPRYRNFIASWQFSQPFSLLFQV